MAKNTQRQKTSGQGLTEAKINPESFPSLTDKPLRNFGHIFEEGQPSLGNWQKGEKQEEHEAQEHAREGLWDYEKIVKEEEMGGTDRQKEV